MKRLLGIQSIDFLSYLCLPISVIFIESGEWVLDRVSPDQEISDFLVYDATVDGTPAFAGKKE